MSQGTGRNGPLPDIRVLIADDERVMRDALADLINASPGMRIVAVTASADEAIAHAAVVRPDVALVDVRMPGGGAMAARGILKASPLTRVVALSASGGRDTVLEMLQAGAAGYLVKGALPSDLLAGIRQVALGHTPLSSEVAGGVIDRLRAQLDTDSLDSERRQRLLDQLTTALDGDGFEMAYQPIYDLTGGQLVGAEALARFTLEPPRPPNEWFADASALGLSVRLEMLALSRAIARRSDLPGGMFLSVNLSPDTLLAAEVMSAVPVEFAARLVIEVTEHTPVADYRALGIAFGALRAAGARLAIDDAGAGYASLRHILELAPDFIKLDQSLTQRIEHDRAAYALAVALTSFAGATGSRIIAEGIETGAQLGVIRSLGIGLGQGFHLGRPGPMGSLAAIRVPA